MSKKKQKNVNRRKKKNKNDFSALRQRLFFRTALIMIFAVAVTYVLYQLASGRFGDFAVQFINSIINNYDRSYYLYDRVFRQNVDLYVFGSVFVIFLLGLRILLRAFSKKFNEINQAIDALADEKAGDVILSPELAATEQKINHIKHQLERQKLTAAAAEQRKNDLVVYLAHDLKTPLSSVIGYLTLLRDEGQISEELREKYLSISLEKAEHLEDLINEFFEITRFNLSNIALEYSRVNLTRLLEQLTFEFKPLLLEKNLKCVLEIAPDTVIKCDVNKMQRVFDNLLRNAVNYSFPNSTIYIFVAQNKNSLSVRFTNCGNTIPKEKLERIFEQFFRLDSSRSTASGGAGLGLAIAKEIVEAHSGTITAKSENEMIEFEVKIPTL